MAKKKTLTFQDELTEFLKTQAKIKGSKKILNLMDSEEKDPMEYFPEMVKNYNALQKEETQLERKLLSTFHWNDFKKLNLPPSTYPKMLRGLPRFYDRTNPAKSQIKNPFTNIDDLRLQYIDKALLHLYQEIQIEDNLQITLLTWVMNDGLGDLYAQLEIAQILKEKIPNIDLHLITIISRDVKIKIPDVKVHKILYQKEKDLKVDLFTNQHMDILSSSALLLQAPTYFPDTEELLKHIKKKAKLMPQYELLGEYGFIDSKHFHPGTKARSLGLNFLEKGILLKKKPKVVKEALLKSDMRERLFGKKTPTPKDLEKYLFSHSFNLGYYYSEEGAYIHIYTLLKKKQKEHKNLDFIVPNPAPLMQIFENQPSEKLFKKFSVKNLEIFFKDKIYQIPIDETGKKVRFFCEESLSKNDFEMFMQLSKDLVAVRGDRSFSEALRANQIYFYDAPPHSKNFLKDLLSLAEYYLKDYPAALQFMRVFSKNIKKKKSKTLYVEEEFFQEDIKLEDLANEAYQAFIDPSCAYGLKKLNRILCKYFLANDFVVSLTKRALLCHGISKIEQYEKKMIKDFLEEKITFSDLIDSLRIILSPHKTKINTF